MLDYRAWIIAGVIILSAAGAYVIWVTRPRAVTNARSLTAGGHPANSPTTPVTKSLHVDGCNEDFIVQPGELVEPRVVPGGPLEQFRTIYGQETKHGKDSATWDENAFSLTASNSDGNSGPDNGANFVNLSVNQGHVVETLDGIELGIDSFGAIFRKMRDKKVEIHERMDGGEGNWTLIVSIYSACGHKFRSEYSRTLPGSTELEDLIIPHQTNPDGTVTPTSGPFRSDVFMNRVVTNYSLVPSQGHDDSPTGLPSEHN
jgi:hypothetical protein